MIKHVVQCLFKLILLIHVVQKIIEKSMSFHIIICVSYIPWTKQILFKLFMEKRYMHKIHIYSEKQLKDIKNK